MFLIITMFLIILIIVVHFEEPYLLACNHIPFSICQTISSTKVLVVGLFGGFLSPTDFITVHGR